MTDAEASAKEATWVALAREGDDLAWDCLVAEHQEPMFRLAYLLLGDVHDAQDVAQAAFIRAHARLEQFDSSRTLRPWLLGITANLARNRRRSLGRYWRALQRLAQERRAEPVVTPDERVDAQLLWQAVRELSPSFQEVIYLRFFLELPEAQTAEALKIAPGTVKSRTHRALKKLRALIEQNYPEIADERV